MIKMKLYNILHWTLLAWLTLVALPGCAQSPETALAQDETEEAPLIRYADVPPMVDPEVRYQLPIDTRIALAGNYGELRPDHFHAGLDFKTDQSIGHPVYSFADGFVRRAAINAYGYGLVLYVEHPALGLTSLYGHLDTFSQKVWQKVRERQVAEQLNNADLTFGPDELPVKRGEVIALSGNTGSSGGPHVHFELRNIPDDDNDIFYDPQMFFLRELRDTQAPRISHVYLYPQRGEGLANGKTTRQVTSVTGKCATIGGEGGRLAQPMTAWGRVGLGVKAYDYMDGQSNKYGVKHLRLLMELPERDEQGQPRYQLLYQFQQDAFRYSETRFTNSVTDYAAWVGQKSMIMKSFVEPGNRLQQIDPALGDGLVTIDQERRYHFIYELEDAHGNLTSLDFDIQGVRQEIPAVVRGPESLRVDPNHAFLLDSAGCVFSAPRGVFYTYADLTFRVADKATAVRTVNQRVKNKKGKWVTVKKQEQYEVPIESRVYTLGDVDAPMHTWCDLSVAVTGSVEHPEQLYLTNLDGSGSVSKSHFVAATADQPATMQGRIRQRGRYAVRRDAKGPEIELGKSNWQKMQLSLSDAGSGVAQFKVMIDGKFVPFDMDHSGQYFGEPCHYGIGQNRTHQVEIWAVDNCGNETRVGKEIRF